MTKVSIIYYSASGTNAATASAVAQGARELGAEVRVRLVSETAPAVAIDSNPAWRAFVDRAVDEPRATPDDVEWGDAVVFGTPTRFGNVASQLKAFIDTLGKLWFQGRLANKVYAGFTSAQNAHGGQESTLLALYNSFYHWSGFIVTPGYSDPTVFDSGGNPYGPSVTVGPGLAPPSEADLAHARYLGKRVTSYAEKLK